MNFCWVTVNVRDMDESLKFYREVVGLSLDRKMSPNPDMQIAFLGDGETKVELIWNAKAGPMPFGGDISVGFTVGSLDDTTAMLKEKGIAVAAGPFQPNPHVRFLYVLDPNGLKIQFVENIA